MLERVRCRIEKCVKFSDLYRLQKSEILFHTIFAEQAEWESRCFIETKTECVNEALRQQSTTLYDANNMFWDDEQAYTDCLNDSSKHISLCACTRSELVWWDYRSQTDVNECWSRRWVIQWALLNNSQKTEIIFYCSRSEGIYNRMLLEQWRKATLLQKTLSVILRTSLYRTDSVYT